MGCFWLQTHTLLKEMKTPLIDPCEFIFFYPLIDGKYQPCAWHNHKWVRSESTQHSDGC